MLAPNKNDLMIIQNDLLGDIKEVKTQLNEKIKILTQTIEEKNAGFAKKLNILEKSYDKLLQQTQSKNNGENSGAIDINSKLSKINNTIREDYIKLEKKINEIDKNLKDTTYKYDREIADNFMIPGLIGPKCKFASLRGLIEYTYKQSNDALKLKEQQVIELKIFREKFDNTIYKNKNELEQFENKINRNIDIKLKELEKTFSERINITEERINTMRMENGKYTFDLTAKLNEVLDKSEKMDNILKEFFENSNKTFDNFKNIIKETGDKLNEFHEKLNTFKKDLNSINKNVEINKSNINKNNSYLKSKIKELENYILNNKNNIGENFDEDASDNNELNYKKIENFHGDSTIISSKKSYEYQKSDESERKQKINNLIFDSEFFGDSNKLGNSSIFQYSNDSDKMKKAQMVNCKIRSGKILSYYPFISRDVFPDNMEEMKNKINENNSREKKDILKLLPKYLQNKKKEKKEIKFTYNNHNYKFLDKKIDILAKAMINNFNKIILQINFLKKNQNIHGIVQQNPLNSIDKEEIGDNDSYITLIHSRRNKNAKIPEKNVKENSIDKRNSSMNYTFYRKINLIRHKQNQKLKKLEGLENNSQY